jgi:hypothetical protein
MIKDRNDKRKFLDQPDFEQFSNKRSFHLMLDKQLYVEFRKILYEHNLSAAHAVNEFINAVVARDHRALGVLNDLALKRMKEKLRIGKHDASKTRIIAQRNRYDADALYKIINGITDEEYEEIVRNQEHDGDDQEVVDDDDAGSDEVILQETDD